MKFTVNQKDLYEALKNVQKITNQSALLKIINHVLFEASDKLYLTASNLDITIKQTINAEITEQGKTCFHSKTLFEIVKNLEDLISFENQGKDLYQIKSTDSEFNFLSLSAEDYPQFDDIESSNITLDSKLLKDAIGKTIYAVGNDTYRYSTNSLLFNFQDVLDLIGTDGPRLSKCIVNTESILNKWLLINKKSALELNNFLSNNGNVSININDSFVSFKNKESSLTLRLVEGEYPDYKKFINNKGEIKVYFNREELLKSIKKVSSISPDVPRIELSFEEDNVILKAISPTYGEAKTEIGIDYEEEPFQITLNSNYLIEALSVLSDEIVCLYFKDSKSPIFIENENGYLALIMPAVDNG